MSLETTFFSQTLPIQGRCINLRSDFNKSLVGSLMYLLSACQDALDPDLYKRAYSKLKNLDIDLKFSGLLSALHLKLYNEVKRKNISGVDEVCHEFLEKNFYISNMMYENLSELKPFYKDMIEVICSSELERENEYYLLNNEDFKHAKILIEKGFEILKNHFLDFYEEAMYLISEILILNAKGIQAGTSSDLFGMIHKNHIYRMEKITDILDFIIHEQSHLYLHLLNKNDQLIENPLDKYESPLRAEERPLIGIYHATFVLSRIIYVLLSAHDKGLIPSSEIEYAKNQISYYIERFNVGYKVLENHAKMTKLGKEIIFCTKSLIESIYIS